MIPLSSPALSMIPLVPKIMILRRPGGNLPLLPLKFPIPAQRHLQVLVLPSYLWFGASLENIQKLPAKSLQLREPDPGREEDGSWKRGRCDSGKGDVVMEERKS